jgi:hypothetical protein
MSDFFTRLIERTMGYAETVQPLISPLYGSLSNGEIALNLPTENLAGIEESEHINTAKNHVIVNKNTSVERVINLDKNMNFEEPIKEKINLQEKDTENNFHSTERDRVDRQDTGSLTKKENITLRDSTNKLTESFSLNLLPEVGSAAVNKSSDPALSADSQETDIREKEKNNNEKRNDKKISLHLLPPSSKDVLSFEKIQNVEYKSIIKNDIYSDLKLSREAPTVKVTIGRVEVKAIIQQKIKQRHALKHEPKLSLDEYLKQRKSGER